jgi:hypothetical protein
VGLLSVSNDTSAYNQAAKSNPAIHSANIGPYRPAPCCRDHIYREPGFIRRSQRKIAKGCAPGVFTPLQLVTASGQMSSGFEPEIKKTGTHNKTAGF